VDWICLAQDRFQWSILENAVIKIPFSWKAGYFLISWATVSFSRRRLFHLHIDNYIISALEKSVFKWVLILYRCVKMSLRKSVWK
jgi:hypothetical protein